MKFIPCAKCGKEIQAKRKKAMCDDCKQANRAEYKRQYDKKNADKFTEYRRQYRQDNAEKIAERNRQYREANPEKLAERNRQWVKDNAVKRAKYEHQYREENAEKMRQWREDNVAKKAEYDRRYYKDNIAELAEYQRQYRDDNTEKIRQYRKDNVEKMRQYRKDNAEKIAKYSSQYAKDNPEKYRIISHNRRICEKNAGLNTTIPLTFEIWEAITEYQNHLCNHCGIPESEAKYTTSIGDKRFGLTMDHMIPISKGGTNDAWNYQALCRPCNTRKGNHFSEPPSDEYISFIIRLAEEAA